MFALVSGPFIKEDPRAAQTYCAKLVRSANSDDGTRRLATKNAAAESNPARRIPQRLLSQ
jgi:hypothetical protein